MKKSLHSSSLRLVSRTVQTCSNLVHIGGLDSISDGLIRRFAQAAVSINVEHIRNHIWNKLFWPFSVAFDGVSNKVVTLMTVHLQLLVRVKTVNIHELVLKTWNEVVCC